MLTAIIVLSILALGGGAYALKKTSSPFNVTDGAITAAAGGRWQTSSAEMRATLKAQTPQTVTVNFTYLGATSVVSKLADGEIRHQFGLKLRAQDICNLVYVMWHFEPTASRIEILTKQNVGKSTSAQCGDAGYTVIKQIPVPYAQVDVPHTLHAEMQGTSLTVTADGKPIFSDTLPAFVAGFNGPVGFRSDNAHVVFDYTVPAQ